MFRHSLFRSKKKTKEKTENDKATDEPIGVPSHQIESTPDRTVLMYHGYVLLEQMLGEGTFSKVRRAYSKHLNNDVAIKIINRDNAAEDFVNRFLPRELEMIKNLKHKNICSYHDILDIHNKVYIVMEYAAHGDLLDFILKNKYLKECTAKDIFNQLTSGIKYLHKRKIFHRDLKCENVLLTKKFRVLITDFGFAKSVKDIHALNGTYCGSSAYAPIEILDGTPYDGCAADVWSLGCILYIMTTGTMPFDDANKREQICRMRMGPSFIRMKQPLSEDIRVLLAGILNPDAKRRLKIEQIQKSKWCTTPINAEENNPFKLELARQIPYI